MTRIKGQSMWSQMSDAQGRLPPGDPPWFGRALLYVVDRPAKYDGQGRVVRDAGPCAVYDDMDAVLDAMHSIDDARVYVLRLNEPPRPDAS